MGDRYELRIQLHNVRHVEVSRPDVIVRVLQTHRGGVEYGVCGSTEAVTSENPSFKRGVAVTSTFGANVRLRFEALEVDMQSSRIQCALGHFVCGLDQVLFAPGRVLTGQLSKCGGAGTRITVTALRLGAQDRSLIIKMSGENLDKKDINGKSDPYVVVSTFQRLNANNYDPNKLVTVFRTEVRYATLNPVWSLQCVDEHLVMNNGSPDPDMPLLFQCYDYDLAGEHDLIGEVQTSVGALLSAPGGELPIELINTTKRRQIKKYTNSGVIKVKACIAPKPRFMDYISTGFRMRLLFAMDFTLYGNEAWEERSSLHYLPLNVALRPGAHVNAYLRLLREVGYALGPYIGGPIVARGFGGRLPPKMNASRNFSLRLDGSDTFDSVEAVEQAYLDSVPKMKFAPEQPKLEELLSYYKTLIESERPAHGGPGLYYVIVVMVSGNVQDLEKVKKLLIDMSTLSVSVVFVSTSKASQRLDVLDGDNVMLHVGNKFAERDIVQSVDGHAHRQDYGVDAIARAVLAEIPNQFVQYMLMKHAQPVLTPEYLQLTSRFEPLLVDPAIRKLFPKDEYETAKYSTEDDEYVVKPKSAVPPPAAAAAAPQARPSTPSMVPAPVASPVAVASSPGATAAAASPFPGTGRLVPMQVYAYYPEGSPVPSGFWIPAPAHP